jgi:uncharacterized protein (DUF305 family)
LNVRFKETPMHTALSTYRLRLVATALAAMLTPGRLQHRGTWGRPTTEPDEVAYNDADVAFLQSMRPHHRGAIEMAEMVPDRTERQELHESAQRMIASQTAEIEQIEVMLAEPGADSSQAESEGSRTATCRCPG